MLLRALCVFHRGSLNDVGVLQWTRMVVGFTFLCFFLFRVLSFLFLFTLHAATIILPINLRIIIDSAVLLLYNIRFRIGPFPWVVYYCFFFLFFSSFFLFLFLFGYLFINDTGTRNVLINCAVFLSWCSNIRFCIGPFPWIV